MCWYRNDFEGFNGTIQKLSGQFLVGEKSNDFGLLSKIHTKGPKEQEQRAENREWKEKAMVSLGGL